MVQSRARQAVVVGTGMIGAVHARAIRAAGSTVRGVLASTPESSRRAADEWGAQHAYSDLDAVLSDDWVDVVHICTPNSLHLPQSSAALRAGKHVVCEKPLATSGSDAERLADRTTTSGRVLAVPFVYRYHPVVAEIRARRQAGEFGTWQLLHGSYLQDWMLPADAANWRIDPELGGPSRAFADIGSHWCDLVEWVAGVRFAEVCAVLATTRGARPVASRSTFSVDGATRVDRVAGDNNAGWQRPVLTEDVGAVLLRTADGVLGTVTVSQVSAGRKNRLWFELDGSTASAAFDQENPETAWLGYPDETRLFVRDPTRGSPEQRRLSVLPAGHAQGYQDCFNAFVADAYQAMDGQPSEYLPSAADGVRAARLVDATLASARSLSWTPVANLTTREPVT